VKEQKELYVLLHHLKNCPADFLTFNHAAGSKPITEALVYDLFRTVSGDVTVSHKSLPDAGKLLWKLGENDHRSIHVGIWFFHQPLFTKDPSLAKGIRTFLFERLPELCQYVKCEEWLENEDRAEEFIREALRCCNIFIDGETAEEAQDRLDALSTIKRQKVLEETNGSLLRMKAIRQAMAEQKAREAANVYGRE
jgi:hypothetical protein